MSGFVDLMDSLESFLYFGVRNITIALAEIGRKIIQVLLIHIFFKYWRDLAVVVLDVVLFLLFHRSLRGA